MALTKKQKGVMIDEASKKLSESKAAVFAGFKGVTVEEFKKLRMELRKIGADAKVLKKRLLNIALKKAGVEFDSMSMKDQLSAVFSKGELSGVAGIVHKFAKDVAKGKKGSYEVLGAYDSVEKRFVDSQEFKVIATLPSREVLLAQIAIMLTMPLKQLMLVINERSKKI